MVMMVVRAEPTLLRRTSSTTRDNASCRPATGYQCDTLRLGRAVPTLTMRCPATEYVASLAMVRRISVGSARAAQELHYRLWYLCSARTAEITRRARS